jgi:hypothetical protein
VTGTAADAAARTEERGTDDWGAAGDAGDAGPAGRPGFATDADLHRRDAPRHCPRCGASLLGGAGIAVEFWQGADRVFHTWCASCRWTGDIIPVTDMIGHEPDH